MQHSEHIVIVGGGFGGLYAARELGRSAHRVTLVDKRNFHLFQPLLYQVATGILTVGDISAQQRVVLRKHSNVRTVMATAWDLDPAARILRHDRGEERYDRLVVCTGVKHQYFGNDHWRSLAPGLKTIEHALEMRHRIFRAFEEAETEADPTRRRRLLNFVVVGGGPTGVELAGALGDLTRRVMVGDFRRIDPREARIVLIEGAPDVLPVYPAKLQARARRYLEDLGVEVRRATMVEDISADRVRMRCGDRVEELEAATVLWAAGVQMSRFGRLVAARTGAETDRSGRLMVRADLSLPSHPEIHVLGDLAHCPGRDGQPLPGLAAVAMQQGRHLGRALARHNGRRPLRAFRYRDRGSLAIIGRYRVVGVINGLRVRGFPAWFIWAVVHILALIEPGQRVSVALHWLWRGLHTTADRLITGDPPKTDEVLRRNGVDPLTFDRAA